MLIKVSGFHFKFNVQNAQRCAKTLIQYSLFKDIVSSKALHKHAKVFFLLILFCFCQALFSVCLVQDLWQAVLLPHDFLFSNGITKQKGT